MKFIFVVSKDALSSLEEVFLLCEEEGVKTRVMLSFFPHVTSKVYLEALQDLPLLTFTTTPQNDYLLLIKNGHRRGVGRRSVGAGGAADCPDRSADQDNLQRAGDLQTGPVRVGRKGVRLLTSSGPWSKTPKRPKASFNISMKCPGRSSRSARIPAARRWADFFCKFSLDELPQLINILKGNMSFVGPRPPLPQEVENYQRWQRRRLRMKPGLTCLWQVRGRNEIDFDEWMKLDLQYIDRWSLLLDIKIVLKTIPIVLLGKGA